MKKKYKIVSPVRFFIFVLVTVLSMTMLVYSLLGFATTEAGTSDKLNRTIHFGLLLISIVASTLILAPQLTRYVNLMVYLLLM